MTALCSDRSFWRAASSRARGVSATTHPLPVVDTHGPSCPKPKVVCSGKRPAVGVVRQVSADRRARRLAAVTVRCKGGSAPPGLRRRVARDRSFVGGPSPCGRDFRPRPYLERALGRSDRRHAIRALARTLRSPDSPLATAGIWRGDGFGLRRHTWPRACSVCSWRHFRRCEPVGGRAQAPCTARRS